jgi:hypothetical protein
VPGRVVIDEWTVTVLGEATLSGAAVARLREVVDAELSATVARLNGMVHPAADVRLLPQDQ